MPIYEYSCLEHGRFERFYSISEKPDVVICGIAGMNPEHTALVTCNLPCEWVPSIPVMRGDSMGTRSKNYIYDSDFGYCDSRQDFDRKMKASGKIIKEPGYEKDVESNAKSIEEKADRKRDKFFEDMAHDGRFEAAMAGTLTKENSRG